MSKRFESVNKDFFSYIEDNRSGLLYCTTNHNDMKDLANLLNKQNQRIAELEEQLKNAIVPKFKFMEKVWHINKEYFYKKDWYIEELLINGFAYKIDKRKNALVMWYSTYFNDCKNYKYREKDLFTTKEEAQAKLEELQEKVFSRGKEQ